MREMRRLRDTSNRASDVDFSRTCATDVKLCQQVRNSISLLSQYFSDASVKWATPSYDGFVACLQSISWYPTVFDRHLQLRLVCRNTVTPRCRLRS